VTTWGPHYEADETMAAPEPSRNILLLAKGVIRCRQIISSRLYVRVKGTCSPTSREFSNNGE